MSLTVIAMTGILVGFLCLAVGFFMDEGSSHSTMMQGKSKRTRRSHRAVGHHHRKAA